MLRAISSDPVFNDASLLLNPRPERLIGLLMIKDGERKAGGLWIKNPLRADVLRQPAVHEKVPAVQIVPQERGHAPKVIRRALVNFVPTLGFESKRGS